MNCDMINNKNSIIIKLGMNILNIFCHLGVKYTYLSYLVSNAVFRLH